MSMFGKLNPQGTSGLPNQGEGGSGLSSASLPLEYARYERLATEHPLLCRQLRSLFFASTYREEADASTSSLSDSEILQMAVSLYSNRAFRRTVVLTNRQVGHSDLDLGTDRDDLLANAHIPVRS